jgi:hypothetical protein
LCSIVTWMNPGPRNYCGDQYPPRLRLGEHRGAKAAESVSYLAPLLETKLLHRGCQIPLEEIPVADWSGAFREGTTLCGRPRTSASDGVMAGPKGQHFGPVLFGQRARLAGAVVCEVGQAEKGCRMAEKVIANARESLGGVLHGRNQTTGVQFNPSSAPRFHCVSGFLMIGVFCSMLPGTNSVFTSVS